MGWGELKRQKETKGRGDGKWAGPSREHKAAFTRALRLQGLPLWKVAGAGGKSVTTQPAEAHPLPGG